MQHELKIFHRVDGDWKIGCLVIMQRSVEQRRLPADRGRPAGADPLDEPRSLGPHGRSPRPCCRSRPPAVAPTRRMLPPSVARSARCSKTCASQQPARFTGGTPLPGGPARRGRGRGAPLFCWVLAEDGKVARLLRRCARWSLAGSRRRRGSIACRPPSCGSPS